MSVSVCKNVRMGRIAVNSSHIACGHTQTRTQPQNIHSKLCCVCRPLASVTTNSISRSKASSREDRTKQYDSECELSSVGCVSMMMMDSCGSDECVLGVRCFFFISVFMRQLFFHHFISFSICLMRERKSRYSTDVRGSRLIRFDPHNMCRVCVCEKGFERHHIFHSIVCTILHTRARHARAHEIEG